MTELDIYRTLLTRAALVPQFLVIEASVNPMPYFGTYLKEHDRDFYDLAQESNTFNWVKSFTAGFEEPYATSLLVDNVANFRVPGNKDFKGLGYSGYLFSSGNYHIKDNELIHDKWMEFEWKIKGERKSPIKKLSWSFRFGAKVHGNPNITDIIYLSFRRSRVDYKSEESSQLNDIGFEYTYDMDRRTLSAIRHYFTLDKKWPVENRQMAFSLAAGFVWESNRKIPVNSPRAGEKTIFSSLSGLISSCEDSRTGEGQRRIDVTCDRVTGACCRYSSYFGINSMGTRGSVVPELPD